MVWSKGQSGNPGGRKKSAIEIGKVAETHLEEALLKIVDLMRNAQDEGIQLKAATYIVDRVCGKPHQEMVQSGTIEIDQTINKPLPAPREEWVKEYSAFVASGALENIRSQSLDTATRSTTSGN